MESWVGGWADFRAYIGSAGLPYVYAAGRVHVRVYERPVLVVGR